MEITTVIPPTYPTEQALSSAMASSFFDTSSTHESLEEVGDGFSNSISSTTVISRKVLEPCTRQLE
jgi:hypothetical protein